MIDKANIQNLYRLSPLQGGMLFHALYDREERSYFEQGVYRIDGPVDVRPFEEAWSVLVERHDALRTAFVAKGAPEPLQIVLRKRPLDFLYDDLSALSAEEQRRRLDDYRAADKERGFDLTADRLLRVALFGLSPDRHMMVLSFHHIIMDGWCQGILAGEFIAAYTALREGQPIPLPPAPQYREYIRWLERQDKEQALIFWTDYLRGFDRATPFPRRPERTAESSIEQRNVDFSLTADETAALREFAARSGVTLGTVVQALWGILLGSLNDTGDALYLTTVSGRPDDLERAGEIVGLFINAVPVRVRFADDRKLADLVAGLRREAAASEPFRFAPLAEIQGTTSLKRDLANVLLVFENYPFAADDGKAPFTFTQEAIDERTNYDLTVQVHPGERLGFGMAFDPAAIDPELIDEVEEWMRGAARVIAESPDAAVVQFKRHPPRRTKFKKGEQEKGVADELKPLEVAVAATFTVDPAIPHLTWWLRERGYDPRVEIAPYNQIFQELLDPASVLSRTDGFGLLAVRFEDWIRDFGSESDDEIAAHLESSYANYLGALDGFGGSATPIHVLLPANLSSFSPAVADKLRDLQERIVRDAAERPGLFLLDGRGLPALYAAAEIFDRIADEAGHVPYTAGMNAAIGTAMARKILSRDQHPFKVIAVDCDNTLWQGICGEDGATGVRVFGGYRALQEFLIERQEEGFLIALCSKNNENDVWEVFEKNEGMILRREHVVGHRINWRPKSGNLRELADELNVGVNSFIFIDDSGMECAEVRENASDVLTLRLPENHEAIARFLGHVWALDKWQVTDEDRKRSGMYRAERERQHDQERAASLQEFLASLDLKIVMAPVADHQVPRVSQLTQRTNQFNVSTIRRDESEIRPLLADDRHVCWMVTVEDRFGEYGLVGIVICRRDPGTLFVDTLLLSCRVLGRGVEEAILTGMRRHAVEHGLRDIEALFVPTKKNAPALHFLDAWKGDRIEEANGNITFRRPVDGLPDGIQFGRFEFLTEPLPEEKQEEIPLRKPSTVSSSGRAEAMHGEGTITVADIATAGWEIDPAETRNLFHALHYIPLGHATADALLGLPVAIEVARSREAAYVPPSTPDELALADLFRQVLRVDSVGMRDDFFELGGHSLTAVELLSRVHRGFETEISLREIFDNPTPELLLPRIRHGEARRLPPIESLPASNHYDLSHAQRRLWALDDIQSEGAAYVMGGAVMVEGELSADALEEAFAGVIRRHESLRTGIAVVNDVPVQRVFGDVPFRIERIDLTTFSDSPGLREERARRIARERERQRFDLSSPPLLRVTLIRLEEEKYVLLTYLHHIVADGWSYPILMRELTALYRAHRNGDAHNLPEPRIHYKEYAAWQRRELESERGRRDEAFWLKHLAAPLPVLDLPYDRRHPASPTYAGDTVRMTIHPAVAEAINALCKAGGSTLFMFLLASVRALLWRYTGGRESVIGVPVAGRDHPDLIDQIGFYVNTLALRGGIDPRKPFAEGLTAVRDEVLEAFGHRSTPFDLIVGKLQGIERETGRSPVFDVMVALQNNRDFDEEIEGLRFRPFGDEAGAGKFDLVFNFSEVAEGIACSLEYRTELFDRTTIEGIAGELCRLIGRLAHSPEIAPVDVVAPFDAVLTEAEGVLSAAVPEGTIVGRFREIAAARPDNIAVREGSREIDYRELDVRSDAIAEALADRGVGKGEIVAVILERGIDSIATMLGIMKRGAIHLPVDPSYPETRVAGILEDSGAVLAVSRTLDTLSSTCARADIYELFRSINETRHAEPVDASDVAYVIYTSGSTGKPKGVCVSHRGFLNMIAAQISTFGVGERDNVLQFASPAFDASMSEIFMALLSGATLTIARRDDVEEIESFLRLLESAGVTVATIPPVYLRAIERRPLPTLRVVITAGEEAPADDVLHYATGDGGRLTVFNAYGPTECSVCATIHRVVPGDAYGERIPIGRAIPGVGAFVADPDLIPVPDGVPGELILYGTGLAEGYLNDPSQTAERFVSPEWFGGVRCYRTGDRGRRLRNGEFEFLGRVDNQVKIRGHRVEPEEARQALLRVPSVRDAAILVVGESPFGAALIGFVRGDEALDPADIQRRIARELPSYLVPGEIHVIDALPTTVNGKVDRKTLLEMYRSRPLQSSGTGAEPATEIEAALATVVADVLRRDSVGLHENFFAIGGDSMKAIQVRAGMRRLGYDLRSRHIFEGGAIGRIAGHVGTLESSREESADVEGEIPLTPIQEWMLERLGPEEAERFGLSLVADARERLDGAILHAALLDLIDRHDALRIVAARDGERISLNVGPRPGAIALREFDLDGAKDVDSGIADLLGRPSSDFAFDGISPLFNAALIRTGDHDVAVLAMHHLVVDALSLDVLLDDLNEAYEARREGKETALERIGASFGAWSRSLPEHAAGIPDESVKEWLETARRVRASGGPFDPTDRSHGTRSFLFTIDRARTTELLAARRKGIDMHHILLAALRRTIESITGRSDLPVMIEGHGRGTDAALDVSRTVGWFTTVYPVVLSGDASSTIDELHAIRGKLDALKGRETEFGALRCHAADENVRTGLDAAPQINFNYLGSYGDSPGSSGRRLFEHTGHEAAGESRGLSDFELHLLVQNGTVKIRCTCGPTVPEAFSSVFGERYLQSVDGIIASLGAREHVEMRLICAPFVGGDARFLAPLAAHLPASVETVFLELPGHGDRLHEAPLERIADIAADLMEQIPDFDLPFVLFGHSMGALLAYEIAHALHERGLPAPEMLICSAATAPRHFGPRSERGEGMDEEIIAAYYSDGGRKSGEELERMIAAARADLNAVRGYAYIDRGRLDLPLTVLYGTADDIPVDLIADWKEESSRETAFHAIDGGHDFPIRNAAATARIMVRECMSVGV